jgi:hypothetical protein
MKHLHSEVELLPTSTESQSISISDDALVKASLAVHENYLSGTVFAR